MNKNLDKDIIDLKEAEEKTTSSHQIIKWWEDKRLLYNVLLFLVEIIVMAYYFQQTENYGLGTAIVHTIFVNIIANIFYSAGWVVEVFINFYSPKTIFSNALRMTLLILGIVFSILLAIVAYGQTLAFYY